MIHRISVTQFWPAKWHNATTLLEKYIYIYMYIVYIYMYIDLCGPGEKGGAVGHAMWVRRKCIFRLERSFAFIFRMAEMRDQV